eukprot:218587_1
MSKLQSTEMSTKSIELGETNLNDTNQYKNGTDTTQRAIQQISTSFVDSNFSSKAMGGYPTTGTGDILDDDDDESNSMNGMYQKERFPTTAGGIIPNRELIQSDDGEDYDDGDEDGDDNEMYNKPKRFNSYETPQHPHSNETPQDNLFDYQRNMTAGQ